MGEIEFRKLKMEDQELIESYLALAPSRSCERTFANIYLWKHEYPTEFAIVEDTLVFRSSDNKSGYAYPAGKPEQVKKAIHVLMQYNEEKGREFVLYNVTEEMFEQLEELYPGQFQVEYDRDVADYVYEREKLETLSGKKLHSKRNHINKFKKVYENWQYETLTEETLEECFQMALKWRNENGCEEDEEKNAEMCVTLNSLRLFKELKLSGGLLRVNGEVVAFTVGESLTEDTFVVHIEKAMANIDGAYPMINQQFVQHECMEYQFINREDDTGAEGLRTAKMSYRPVFFVEKGLVTKKMNGESPDHQ